MFLVWFYITNFYENMAKVLEQFSIGKDLKDPIILFGLFWYVVLTLVLALFIGNLWAAICFSLAAYAVIGNDAVQTLMTYLHSNNDIPWKYLYGWVAAVLLWVIWYWFLTNGWDITYGRLDAKGYTGIEVDWYIVIFPLILVFLTRFRWIPVSTSLLILSIFASELLFQKIVMKSALGYLVAFIASFSMWMIVESILKRKPKKAKDKVFNFTSMLFQAAVWAVVIMVAIWYVIIPLCLQLFSNFEVPAISNFQLGLYTFAAFLFVLWILYERKVDHTLSRNSMFWRIAQTFTTVLLFSTWLMHDMVNIAVFLWPTLSINIMVLISFIFLLGLAYTFRIKWWPVWNIVTKKTSTNEIVAATMIDLVYFAVLLIFKEWSDIPMSTTWVFVWLLAGRQLAIRSINRIDVVEWKDRFKVAFKEIWKDFSKIMVGLGISVVALIVVRAITT